MLRRAGGHAVPPPVVLALLLLRVAPAAGKASVAEAPTAAVHSCARYECAGYNPQHKCQCNPECVKHSSCCFDYPSVCTGAGVAAPRSTLASGNVEAKEHASAGASAAVANGAVADGGIASASAPAASTTTTAVQTTTAAQTTTVAQTTLVSTVLPKQELSPYLSFDMYRAMASSAVDTHTMEDDDMADLGGVMKYIHTEIMTEHLGDPLRTTRKYGIDVLTRHRYKIKNGPILASQYQVMGEFGPFVTYDWGEATNKVGMPLFEQFGDFVGVQPGCGSGLHCDVRYPSAKPYSWFSVGNWCPNLPWDKKGTKANPNPECLRLRGTTVMGGLCSSGFDAGSFVPSSNPTGQNGCVYTYGQALVVPLDALAGIMEQDCGGRRCTSWLDFRHNCTDSRLRRQFSMAGEVVNVPYCVEFDIHPACEAMCESPECQKVLNGGGDAYLGLPFWHGRCNPRANVQRTEQAAAAFGVPGALRAHTTVDREMLTAAGPCPFSGGTSWACYPDPPGRGGPFCTRAFNGACQPCYIPGAEAGPEPAPKPWCPFDVLAGATYADAARFKLPACKSKRASEGCCLYSGTCEGSSEPLLAPLSDDGLALVASRRRTEDMEVFLGRAAVERRPGATMSAEAMARTAYFGWDQGPMDITLDALLDELTGPSGLSHAVPVLATPASTTSTAWRPQESAAVNDTTSATTTAAEDHHWRPPVPTGTTGGGPTVTGGPTTALAAGGGRGPPAAAAKDGGDEPSRPPNTTKGDNDEDHLHRRAPSTAVGRREFLPTPCTATWYRRLGCPPEPPEALPHKPAASGCFEEAVAFLPLDMPGTVGTIEVDAAACQHRCNSTKNCKHFSFMPAPGIQSGLCHVEDISAAAQPGSVGYVSGPYKCWADMPDKSALIDKGHGTFVSSELACLEWGTTYNPPLPGKMRTISEPEGDDERAVKICAEMCAADADCEHFSLGFPMRLCTLAGADASRMDLPQVLSGPRNCSQADKQAFFRLFAQRRHWHREPPEAGAFLSKAAFGIMVALAAGWALPSAVRWRLAGAGADAAQAPRASQMPEEEDGADQALLGEVEF